MDTNLKSSREIRTIVTIVILILFAAGIVGSYYVVSRNNIASTVTVEEDIEDCIQLPTPPLNILVSSDRFQSSPEYFLRVP